MLEPYMEILAKISLGTAIVALIGIVAAALFAPGALGWQREAAPAIEHLLWVPVLSPS